MGELQSIPTIILDKFFDLNLPDYFVMFYFILALSLIVFFFMTRELSLKHPSPIQQILEITVEGLEKMLDDVIGKDGKRYLAPVGTFGVLILMCNLFGFIPGFMPPTGSLIVTLSLGICSFITYNFIGLAKGGFSYLKHFLGPIAMLGIIYAPIEIVSHCSRPFSLGIRLFCNIFGDHQIGGIFLTLVPFGIPVAFILLGLFVACMQAFVFFMLSAVYISLALPSEEKNH